VTHSKSTRTIIDTHRHIFGPKLLQKFVENIGFDDSKPLPQANAGEMFFYRESVDVDYSMEIQRLASCPSLPLLDLHALASWELSRVPRGKARQTA
jgi:hypothetical protein